MTSRPAVPAIAGSTRRSRTARAVNEPEPSAIDIVSAMSDKALFEPWFRGETWDGWRAVLKAAYALPMTADEIDFFRTVAERDPPKRRVSELWCIVDRKSTRLNSSHANISY